jgi:hypothetical protein
MFRPIDTPLPQGERSPRSGGGGKPHVPRRPKSPQPLSLAIAGLLQAPPADMSVPRQKTENTPDFSIIKKTDASRQRARFYWRIKKIAFPTLQ